MSLWRIAIDEVTGDARGDPEPITFGGGSDALHVAFSAGSNRLVYIERRATSNVHRYRFDNQLGMIEFPGEGNVVQVILVYLFT